MMRGFKGFKQEKMREFCKLIQKEAKKLNCVFFAYAPDTNPEEYKDLIVCDYQGWLIPEEYADEAELTWQKSNAEGNMVKWEDYFLFAVWSDVNGQVKIEFKTYDWE